MKPFPPCNRKQEGGARGKKRKRSAEPMSPLSPSQLTALPKAAKYMEKEEECVVWNEETADNVRRRELRRRGATKPIARVCDRSSCNRPRLQSRCIVVVIALYVVTLQ